jgi:hypothetical protein
VNIGQDFQKPSVVSHVIPLISGANGIVPLAARPAYFHGVGLNYSLIPDEAPDPASTQPH